MQNNCKNLLQRLKFQATFAILLHSGEAPSGVLHPALGSSESFEAAGPSPEETMEMVQGLSISAMETGWENLGCSPGEGSGDTLLQPFST